MLCLTKLRQTLLCDCKLEEELAQQAIPHQLEGVILRGNPSSAERVHT